MNREQIIATLRVHEPELKALGVVSISLFGSAARGENSPQSDVDVAVRLDQNFSNPGFDYFTRLEDLRRRLCEILDCSVDVVEEPVQRERLQRQIDMDRSLAF